MVTGKATSVYINAEAGCKQVRLHANDGHSENLKNRASRHSVNRIGKSASSEHVADGNYAQHFKRII